MEIFNEWNILKKSIATDGIERYYREKEIWWVCLGKNIGSEQDGKGKHFDRPVLIVKSFSRYVCLIVPLTTSLKVNRYHVSVGTIDSKLAFAIISQIRLIDTKRLQNKICNIENKYFDEIRKAIRNLF